MKTVKINIYKFNELNESAKQNALEKLWDMNVDQEWYEFTIDELKEELKSIGFVNPEIEFSGFSSQGDGASFTSDGIDIYNLIDSQGIEVRPMVKRLLEQGEIEIDYYKHHRFNSRDVHERSTSIDINFGCSPHLSSGTNICEYMDGLFLPLLEDLTLELNKKIYKELENEYEYQTSEEQVKESIEANDYDFTEDGEMY